MLTFINHKDRIPAPDVAAPNRTVFLWKGREEVLLTCVVVLLGSGSVGKEGRKESICQLSERTIPCLPLVYIGWDAISFIQEL